MHNMITECTRPLKIDRSVDKPVANLFPLLHQKLVNFATRGIPAMNTNRCLRKIARRLDVHCISVSAQNKIHNSNARQTSRRTDRQTDIHMQEVLTPAAATHR